MDIVKREQVNVLNVVIVSGITWSEKDRELESWLSRYGDIKRTLHIDDQYSEFHHQAIIEFQDGSAMGELRPLLPACVVGASGSDTTFNVRTLSSVYSQVKEADVNECLAELQEIARTSGRSFYDMLQELKKLTVASSSSEPLRTHEFPIVTDFQSPRPFSQNQKTVEEKNTTSFCDRASSCSAEPGNDHNLSKTDKADAMPDCSGLPLEMISPPNIQRVVVEHIVLATDAEVVFREGTPAPK